MEALAPTESQAARRLRLHREAQQRHRRGIRLERTPGLRRRLVEWFECAGPADCLSASDVSIKFGVSIRYARNVLSELRAERFIQRETVWRIRSVK